MRPAWIAASGRLLPCGLDVVAKAPLDRVAGQRAAVARGKQRAARLVGGFAQPAAEYRDGLLGQRRDPFLSAFADRPDVRAGTELRVGAGEAEQLGDAQSGLDGREQQRVVAPAGPC